MVNLFRLPDPNSEWIGRLSSGQQVAIASQWKGWYAIVMTDKSQAYVSAKGIKLLPFAVLTLEEAEATETPVPEGEPDAPPMRVVGIIFGKERSATLQVGGEYLQVMVGQQFPKDKPLFTVVAIDDEKVHLTREWKLNGKTRIQRIVVSLSASPPPSINAK